MENLFNTGKLEESEYLVLSEWFNFLVSSPQMNFNVDQIIYLRTKPEVISLLFWKCFGYTQFIRKASEILSNLKKKGGKFFFYSQNSRNEKFYVVFH